MTPEQQRARLLAIQEARRRQLLQRQLLLRRRQQQQALLQRQQQQQQQQQQQRIQRPQRTVDITQLSDTQLRQVLNRVDGATLRRILTSGRITVTPNIERPTPITAPGAGLRTTGQAGAENPFRANVVRNIGTGRGVIFISDRGPTAGDAATIREAMARRRLQGF